MDSDLSNQIRRVVKRAPEEWLQDVCAALRRAPPGATASHIKISIPEIGNGDLVYLLNRIVDAAVGDISWEALGCSLEMALDTYREKQSVGHIEMLWSGPPPGGRLPARRIDQVLYDLIAEAKGEVLLVTFAAARVERLAAELTKTARRGVRIRMVLEFAETSEGQLSFDALNAFPDDLVRSAEVYFWPVEKRERNHAGRPGKLHAKLAVIDDVVLVSSANLTDDAFTRNLELGAKLTDPDMARWTRDHFDGLIRHSTLKRIERT